MTCATRAFLRRELVTWPNLHDIKIAAICVYSFEVGRDLLRAWAWFSGEPFLVVEACYRTGYISSEARRLIEIGCLQGSSLPLGCGTVCDRFSLYRLVGCETGLVIHRDRRTRGLPKPDAPVRRLTCPVEHAFQSRKGHGEPQAFVQAKRDVGLE